MILSENKKEEITTETEKKRFSLPPLERKRKALDVRIQRREKLNEEIKQLQGEIATLEAQELTKSLRELNISPAQALDLLKKSKGTLLSQAQEVKETKEEEGVT